MGKSKKKPNVEIVAARVSVPPTKAAKKDKRGIEEAAEERASCKKQKIGIEQKDQKKKKIKKLKKDLIEPPVEKKEDGSSSDFEEGFAVNPITAPSMKAAAKGRGAEEATEKRASSTYQILEVEKKGQSKKMVNQLKTLIESPGKRKDESRCSDVGEEKSGAPKTKPVSAAKKKPELNDGSFKNDSDEDRKLIKSKPKVAVVVSKKKADYSDSSSDSDSGEEVKKKASLRNVSIAKFSKNTEFSDSSSESDSDEEDVRNAFSIPKAAASAPKKKSESSSSSLDVSYKETDDKKRDFLPNGAKNKEMSEVSGKEPETPAKRNEESGGKRLFVGNLPPEITKDDLLEFFGQVGKVTEVRLATKEDGSFRGFGHVEFVNEASAQAALKLNGHVLLGRPLIVDLARERGSNNYHAGIGAQDPGHSVYVKGFGKSVEEYQIRNLLKEHFGSYGEIIRVSIPQDNKTGRSKGFAYVLFNDQATASKALELNGSELGGYTLTVQEPAPKSGTCDGAYSGRTGRGGRSLGQVRGHDGGGRGRGRGGREAGASYNRSVTTASKGRRTTFGDNA